MSTYKVSGLPSRSGEVKSPLMKPGRYVVTCTAAREPKRSKNDNGTLFGWDLNVTDALGNAADQDPNLYQGRNQYFSAFIMDEDHPGYDQWHHLGEEQLKNFLDAFGVPIADDGGFDPEDAVDNEAVAKIKVKKAKTEDDDDRNEVVEFKPLED